MVVLGGLKVLISKVPLYSRPGFTEAEREGVSCTDRYTSQSSNNYFTKKRLIDLCIPQL